MQRKPPKNLSDLLSYDFIDLVSCYDEKNKSLDLSSQGVTAKDMSKDIIPFLQAHPDITELNLSNNPLLGSEGTNQLADYLKKRPSLRVLKLNNCGLKGIDMHALSQLKHLVRLNVSHNRIGDYGLANLRLPFLVELDISHNKIIAEGGLSQLISRHPYLTHLNISHNNIGDKGVAILTLNLPRYKKPFTSLNLSHCGLDDKGILACAALPHLTTFVFNKNKITFAGAKAILALDNIHPLKRYEYVKQIVLETIPGEFTDEEKLALWTAVPSLNSLVLFQASQSIPGLMGSPLWLRKDDSHSLEEDKEVARKNAIPLLYRIKDGENFYKYFLYGDPDGNDEHWQETAILAPEGIDLELLFTNAVPSAVEGFTEIKRDHPLFTKTLINILSEGHYHLIPYKEKESVIKMMAIAQREEKKIIEQPSTLHSLEESIEVKIFRGYDPKTNSLSLSSLNLTDQEVIDFVLPFLKSHSDILSLDLSHNRIGSEGLSELADYLYDKNLKTLNLSDNIFSVNSPEKFNRYLTDIGRLKSLTTLEIADNHLPLNTVSSLLPYLPYLESLNVSGNPLNDEDIQSISEYKSLRNIKMSNCSIGNKISNFKYMPNLVELDISHNEIKSLPYKFTDQSKLQTLILDDNPIGQNGHECYCLGKIKNLKVLHLARCNIEKSYLYDLIKTDQFTDLNISGNNIPYYLAFQLTKLNPVHGQKYLEQIWEEAHFSELEKKQLQIHHAVSTGNLEKVKRLAQGNPLLLTLRDARYYTPLVRAVINGHEEVAAYIQSQIVESEWSINFSNAESLTVARWAFIHEPSLFLRQVRDGFDINQPISASDPSSPFFIDKLIIDGNKKLLKDLISAFDYADLKTSHFRLLSLFSFKNQNGQTPLELAVAKNNNEIAEFLLEEMLNADALSKITAIQQAVIENKIDDLKVLVESFITYARKNCDFVCAVFKNKAICDALFKAKLSRLFDNYIAKLFLPTIKNRNVEIVNYLLSKDINISYDTSLLSAALKYKDPAMTVALLRGGAHIPTIYKADDFLPAFRFAVTHDDIKIVSMLMQEGIDVTQSMANAPNSLSLIQQAASDGKLEMVKAMVQGTLQSNKCKPEKLFTSTEMEKSLKLAAEKNHQEVVWYLLGEMLEKDGQSKKYNLISATIRNKMEEVENIIQDFSKNANDNYELILKTANAANFSRESFETLYKQKLTQLLESKNVYGETLLFIAAEPNDGKLIKYLLELGTHLNVDAGDKNGTTPLMRAARYGRTATVTYLLDHGADLKRQNNTKQTALYFAFHFHHAKTVAVLVQRGADVTQPFDPSDPNSPSYLEHAKSMSQQMREALVKKNPMFKFEDKDQTLLPAFKIKSVPRFKKSSHQHLIKQLINPPSLIPAKTNNLQETMTLENESHKTIIDEESVKKPQHDHEIKKHPRIPIKAEHLQAPIFLDKKIQEEDEKSQKPQLEDDENLSHELPSPDEIKRTMVRESLKLARHPFLFHEKVVQRKQAFAGIKTSLTESKEFTDLIKHMEHSTKYRQINYYLFKIKTATTLEELERAVQDDPKDVNFGGELCKHSTSMRENTIWNALYKFFHNNKSISRTETYALALEDKLQSLIRQHRTKQIHDAMQSELLNLHFNSHQ